METVVIGAAKQNFDVLLYQGESLAGPGRCPIDIESTFLHWFFMQNKDS